MEMKTRTETVMSHRRAIAVFKEHFTSCFNGSCLFHNGGTN